MGGLSGSSILGDSQGQGVQDPQGKTWGPDTGQEGTGQRESMQAGQTRLHEPRATSHEHTDIHGGAGRARGWSGTGPSPGRGLRAHQEPRLRSHWA